MSVSCVTMMIVFPAAFSRRSNRMISSLVCESRLPVGSSAKITCGSFTSARAMATRCCCPPDSCVGLWSSRPPSPTISASATHRARISGVGGRP
jgi:hypothetical protein